MREVATHGKQHSNTCICNLVRCVGCVSATQNYAGNCNAHVPRS